MLNEFILRMYKQLHLLAHFISIPQDSVPFPCLLHARHMLFCAHSMSHTFCNHSIPLPHSAMPLLCPSIPSMSFHVSCEHSDWLRLSTTTNHTAGIQLDNLHKILIFFPTILLKKNLHTKNRWNSWLLMSLQNMIALSVSLCEIN